MIELIPVFLGVYAFLAGAQMLKGLVLSAVRGR